MPTIYDNIDTNLLDGLKSALTASGSRRIDICVGYINLRGWKCIADEIDTIPGQDEFPPCRLIVGMNGGGDYIVRNHYNQIKNDPSNKIVADRKKRFAESLARQLTWGIPTAGDEAGLRKLARQLRSKKVLVRFFGNHLLHAKLYLAHREDVLNPITGFVGSSNLTLSGLGKQGELNVDVMDKDATQKLANWFEERWQDSLCLDITDELADIIEQSWAGGPVKPYEIYIKTAYELSKEAIEGSREFKVPVAFDKVMLEFQKQAVSLAAERLSNHGGVIVGDVVGLGKTLVASAVAKTFQEDRGDNVLVICPPKLEEMWKGYLYDYKIAGETLSLGQSHKLPNMRRYRLVVIDESHNLRNRDSKRYGYIHDYIRDNESRVILLTATPYNKQFTDIGNQLRLFIEADADLGVRPEGYIQSLGGTDGFKSEHANALTTSLAAFEHSNEIDDWRELMRMFMVRRTRSHIKKNYAEYDEERKQHYLTFQDDTRFYFPYRSPKSARFSLDKDSSQDQYARLYSPVVVDIINALTLPRYGLGKYLLPEYQDDQPPGALNTDEKQILKNLSRAGAQLIGFARSGLFKRLESSGYAFLLSIKRHIVRNAIYLSAWEQEGKFPIGDILTSLADETVEESEENLLSTELLEENDVELFLEIGKEIYGRLSSDEDSRKKFHWVKTNLFKTSLKNNLLEDCLALSRILKLVPKWSPDTDRKLDVLARLCGKTHREEKLLIFTQFKDTADYLHRQLTKRGISQIAEVFGGMEDISSHVKRFSPTSNDELGRIDDELRVLITTDTLSEGQNLQDAHIIVNFDLPWAIIRLVQRAGRVDRIGQEAPEILCYCFLPEDGIDNILDLRNRLQSRIRENAELIGSDEVFFEGNTIDLKQVYEETISIEEDDETDLISRAYDIWRQAVKDDPNLEERIQSLPNVVYSAKRSDQEKGAIAYIKTSRNQHILARLNEARKVTSQSQSKILDWLACKPDEPLVQPAENHHDLVAAAVRHVKAGQSNLGGQLGSTRSIQNRVYSRLELYLQDNRETFFESEDLRKAVQQIHDYPLKETARDRLGRQLRANISYDELAKMVEQLYNEDKLCALPKADEPIEPRIICSMGLVK